MADLFATAPALKFKPRPYQQTGVERAWKLSEKATIGTALISPTGTGKTPMLAMLAALGMDRGGVLVIVDREEIVVENAIKIEQFLQVPCEMELNTQSWANWTEVRAGGVCSASTSTLQGKRLVNVPRDAVRTILVDEGHWRKRPEQGGKINRIINWFSGAKVFGLTGTAIRPGNTPLIPHCYDQFVDLGTLWNFIDWGWLADIRRLHLTKVSAKIDWKQVTGKANITEKDKIAAWEAHNCEAVALFRQAILDYAGNRPTVAFCESVQHAMMLADGINHVRHGGADYVASYILDEETGEKRNYPHDRRARIKSLIQSGDMQYVTNVGVFQEGVDIPELSCVAWGTITKSWRKLAQGSGRGVRPFPGCLDGLDNETNERRREAIKNSPKPDMLLLDPVGITSEHDLTNPLKMVQGDKAFDKKAYDFSAEYMRERDKKGESTSLTEAVEVGKLRASAWYDAIRSALQSANVKVDWATVWMDGPEARERRALPKAVFEKKPGLPVTVAMVTRILKMQTVLNKEERLNKQEVQAMSRQEANEFIERIKEIREHKPTPGWVAIKLRELGADYVPDNYGPALRLMGKLQGMSRQEVKRHNEARRQEIDQKGALFS